MPVPKKTIKVFKLFFNKLLFFFNFENKPAISEASILYVHFHSPGNFFQWTSLILAL